MSDKYQEIVSGGVGKTVATKLGLPRPAILRRYKAGAPLVNGPVLVGAIGEGVKELSDILRDAGADVQTEDSDTAKWGALVLDATGAETPADLAGLQSFFGGALRRLKGGGRVVVLGRVPDGESPVRDAARHGLDGFIRSLAKEVRGGATANLVLLEGDASPESALRFFLSGRSAYVDGQVVRVGAGAAPAPADWNQPLAGKVAVVTGAARGIGAAIAEVLARDGATVICADLPSAGDNLAKVANKVGGTTLQLDISAPDAAERMLELAKERYGKLDIVIHNAGITRDKLLANMKPEVWSSVMAVNLESQLRVNAALLASDVFSDDGRIVCLASTSGIAGNRGQTNYAASKAGVIGMVRSFAPAFAKTGATINAIAPGFIDTDMTHAIPFATREVARRLNALQQAGLPVDVAETAAWFASSSAGGVNGQVLRVCGQNLVGA
ncbi:3-oxoacyl-[acyl-carrier protein] reductase [Frankineae bacterium MT45]|nr:3-oxoacyl-[acyl-carrier protein] reductase [Frankineae bacterium MT45]